MKPTFFQSRGVCLGVLLLVWAAIFLPRLGASGLSMTEGHRAIPAWEMLDSGSWFVPTLFERPYLRKPPGIQWAIAASTAVFGETEFAARLPSALGVLAGAVTMWLFARRWYGPPFTLSAGLAYLLMPLLWPVGRSAEIESLHTAAIVVGVLALLDPVVRGGAVGGRSSRAAWAMSVVAGVAIAAAVLLKGPSGLPVLLAAALVSFALPGGLRREPLHWLGAIVTAAVVLVPVGLAIRRDLASLGEPAVTQGLSEFLWSFDRLASILALAPAALLSALPSSLAMLFPWGGDARGEQDASESELQRGDFARMRSAARLISLVILMSLGFFTLLGVSNPRYAMPAVALAPATVAYVFRGMARAYTPTRRRIAAVMTLDGARRAWVPIVVLTLAGVAWAQWNEGRRERASGRAAGIELSRSVSPGAVMYADHMIEARPEVLWYAQRAAGGNGVRFLWRSLRAEDVPPVPGGWLLRSDAGSDEVARGTAEGWLPEGPPAAAGNVYKFSYELHLRR